MSSFEHIIENFIIIPKDMSFWSFFAIYIIVSLVTIILTGMLLMAGYNKKTLLWFLFALNIIFFIIFCISVFFKPIFGEIIAFISLILQIIMSFVIIHITNSAGNIDTKSGSYAALYLLIPFFNGIYGVCGFGSVITEIIFKHVGVNS